MWTAPRHSDGRSSIQAHGLTLQRHTVRNSAPMDLACSRTASRVSNMRTVAPTPASASQQTLCLACSFSSRLDGTWPAGSSPQPLACRRSRMHHQVQAAGLPELSRPPRCWTAKMLTHVLGCAGGRQASHAPADDEHLGRRNPACSCDLPGKEAWEQLGCLHHCPARPPQYGLLRALNSQCAWLGLRASFSTCFRAGGA